MKYVLDMLDKQLAEIDTQIMNIQSEMNDKNVQLQSLAAKSAELQRAVQAIKMIR